MIGIDSRYAESTIVSLMVNGVPRQTIVPSSPEDYSFSYTTYQLTGSDRPDLISNAFYGTALWWWKVADANPEILNWDNLEPGRLIRIPVA